MSELPQNIRQELAALLDALVDLGLEPAQQARLNELLRTHAEARRDYREYLAFHAVMHWESQDQAGIERSTSGVAQQVPTAPQLPPVPSTPVLGFLGRVTSAVNRPVFWSILGVAALFYGTFTVISWNLRSKSLPSGTDGNELAVALIRNMEDVGWSGDSSPPRSHGGSVGGEGASIRRGEPLKIDSGLVELQLKQGTTLVVEGPAEWSIDGDNSATLKLGKLVATVPTKAIGFTLDTPTSRIVDLGTEFGVEVAEDGAADVHVSKGKVDVQSPNATDKRGPGKLKAGQSLQIRGQTSKLTNDPAIADKFKRLAEAGKSGKSLPTSGQSNRYAECVKALEPLVYLPVEQNDGLALADHAGKHAGKFTRTEGPGDAWEKGPFGDALRFRGAKFSDRVTIEPKDSQDANRLTFSRGKEPGLPFTIALWARCQPGQYTGLLVGKGAGFQEQYLFDILNGKYRFVIISADRKSGGEIYSLTPFDGTWQHVAATFDPEQKSISIYVNGNREANAALKDVSLFATDETTYVGNRPFRDDHNKLTLDGALDEIAIFPRALSASEINSMYRLQPTRAPSTK